jgi:hypothetical protein
LENIWEYWQTGIDWCIYLYIHQSTRTCQKTCLSVFLYIFQAKYVRKKKINENKLVGVTVMTVSFIEYISLKRRQIAIASTNFKMHAPRK